MTISTIREETAYIERIRVITIALEDGTELSFETKSVGGTEADDFDDTGFIRFDGKSQKIYDALAEDEQEAIDNYIQNL